MPGAIPAAEERISRLKLKLPSPGKAWYAPRRKRPIGGFRGSTPHKRRDFLAHHRELTYQQIMECIDEAAQRPADGPVYHLKLDEFVLEKLDPNHRPGRGLAIIWDLYRAGEYWQYAIDLPVGEVLPEFADYGTGIFPPNPYFFKWINDITAAGSIWISALLRHAYCYYWYTSVSNRDPNWQPTEKEWGELNKTLSCWPDAGKDGVKFVTGLYSIPNRVWRTRDGRLGWNFNCYTGEGDYLDTGNTMTAFGTSGYIWTLNSDGEFYTSPQQVGRLHHSTLTAGRGVLAAGEWTVNNGRLVLISAQTGHYRVPMRSLVPAIERLANRLGVSPDTYKVKIFAKLQGLKETHMIARQFYNGYKHNAAWMEYHYQSFGR